MAFQVKNFVSIVASMLNHMRSVQDKVTDLNVGSVARTLVEAPAIEIDELYQQMFHGLKEAIPAAIYTSFDFTRKPAAPASGLIRVTVTSSASPVSIPSGTVFASAGSPAKMESQSDVTIAAGQTYADVFVSAQSSGVSTNITSGLSFSVTPQPANFVSAINAAAFNNGANLETDDQRKRRFANYIASLNHGTVAALKYGLKTTELKDANGLVSEYVKFASVHEPYLTDSNVAIAWVECFIHNGISGASSNLLTHAAEVIAGYYDSNGVAVPGWKAAGVKVDVLAATSVSVNVTAVLTALPGYSKPALIATVTDEINAYLSELDIGETAVRSEIIAAAMAVPGVYNFVVSVPSGDTTTTYSQKAVPGTIAIT